MVAVEPADEKRLLRCRWIETVFLDFERKKLEANIVMMSRLYEEKISISVFDEYKY